jgi:hypothetical protein
MRKKIFYISAFLIFALLLSGCTGGKPTVPEVPTPTDKDLIIDVIEKFFSALSEQKWGLAESYCVDGSVAYEVVDDEKKSLEYLSSQCFIAILNFSPDISLVEIVGDKALAYGYLTIVVKCDGKEHNESREYQFSLQKIGSKWKLLGMVVVP